VELTREITIDDVEMLLGLQIKRISKFDLQKNEDDKLTIVEDLKEVRKNLRQLTSYVIGYLEGLIERYGKQYKRRTQSTTAEEIDVRELTANELAIVYDRERGFLGSEVKGEAAFRCSPLDRLLVVWKNSRYQMIPPPDKLFVDKDVEYFNIYNREKIFTVVYKTPKATFIKRFAFGGAIMNRDYFCAQEDAEIKFITDRPVTELRLKYRHAKGTRVDEHTVAMKDIQIRGPKSRGVQITKRMVTSVSAR
jgi:topoisomerase-4 subunit A